MMHPKEYVSFSVVVALLLMYSVMLKGCSEPTVVQCKMQADGCFCECSTQIENPTTIKLAR